MTTHFEMATTHIPVLSRESLKISWSNPADAISIALWAAEVMLRLFWNTALPAVNCWVLMPILMPSRPLANG